MEVTNKLREAVNNYYCLDMTGFEELKNISFDSKEQLDLFLNALLKAQYRKKLIRIWEDIDDEF